MLHRAGLVADVKHVSVKNPVEAVVAESGNHDLLVVGAGERWTLFKAAFGAIEDDIAARAKCPVVLFRRGVRPASGG